MWRYFCQLCKFWRDLFVDVEALFNEDLAEHGGEVKV